MRENSDIDRLLLLEAILHGEAVRGAVGRQNHLRPATVSAAAERLKRRNLLLESRTCTAGAGRKGSPLSINPKFGNFLGLELHHQSIRLLLIDGGGNELQRLEEPLPSRVDGNAEQLLQLLQRFIKRISQLHPIAGAGFADPGLVDQKQGISVKAVNLPGWENVRTADFLRKITGDDSALLLPECAAKTYMEYLHFNRENPVSTLFHVSLGEGIAGGFIRNGELLKGNQLHSIEIGHLVVSPNGRRCRCGNRGCLEAIAGLDGLRGAMQELIAGGVSTRLQLNDFNLDNFIRAVHGNDRAANVLAQETCERLANALSTAVTLFNPELLVLSGPLTGLGDILTETVKRTFARRCLPESFSPLRLELSCQDSFSAARGVALLRRNQALESAANLPSRSVQLLSAGAIL